MTGTALQTTIELWHAFVRGERPDALDELLHEDAVFYSPVVYTPQAGKAVTAGYLRAAVQTLAGGPTGGFAYTKQVLAGDVAVLEFETTLDGMYVNGVDIIVVDEAGRIVEFRVMLRPLKAVNLVHQHMARALERAAQSEAAQSGGLTTATGGSGSVDPSDSADGDPA